MRKDDDVRPGCGQLETTPNGVLYEWGLASWKGAWFHLWRMSDQSLDDIKCAAQHLRNTQDVVRVSWGWLHPAAYVRNGRLVLPASAEGSRRVRGVWTPAEETVCQ